MAVSVGRETAETRSERAPASEPLRRFLQVARGAGLRVSAAEGIDAARAVDLIGYGDRAVLKDTLAVVLAKTPDEKAVYEQTFDLFFRRDEFTERPPLQKPSPAGGQQMPGAANPSSASSEDGAGQALAQMLSDEDGAALSTALETAAREAGVEQIRFFTQKNRYVRHILDRMGLKELEREISALRARDEPEAQARAQNLDQGMERLWDAARDYVERAMLLYARGETEQMRERILKAARLENIDRRDLERMRILVRQIAKRLATRYSRKRRRRQRGQLDVRRTMRRNMGWGGIPFITTWKQKQLDKPRVMVLCDVSGSVAWVAEFLLMLIYSLNEVLSDIRAFAYTSELREVSETLERHTIDEAVAHIMSTIGFGTSNYGTAFEDFEDNWMKDVTSKTTILILGDARGNGNAPRADILADMANRAKRVIWLNPEYRSSWGTGDSDMYRYAPYCKMVRVCASLNDLERVVTDMLEMDA
jgi:uncharacterized protein with von Willebrand factor type A (vWA) domain